MLSFYPGSDAPQFHSQIGWVCQSNFRPRLRILNIAAELDNTEK
jgi:hypothetical protein